MTLTTRQVARIIEPQAVVEGAGVRLKRSIAGWALDYLDPFLLFDHFGSDKPADYLAGFPMHPHRGIETVTYMLAGVVQHRDSLGNAGSIAAGDVQWMTAGGGILHEEMPQPAADGRMAGFQLWVNLPAQLKMTRPRYQEVPAGRIPEARLANGVRVRVVAGRIGGVSGPVTEIVANPTYWSVVPAATASSIPSRAATPLSPTSSKAMARLPLPKRPSSAQADRLRRWRRDRDAQRAARRALPADLGQAAGRANCRVTAPSS